MAFPLIPLIGAAASIGSTYISSRAQKKSTEKSADTQMELAKYQYQQEQKQIEAQNKYNAPKSQMKRFREAGLNPNLIYSQGSPGQQANIPKYQAPRVDYQYAPSANPSAVLGTYNDLRQQNAQVDLAKENARVQRTIQDLNMTKESGIFQDNIIKSVEATIASHLMENRNIDDLSEIASGRIGAMKADNLFKQANAQIQKWAADLSKRGMTPRDSIYLRAAIGLLNDLGYDTTRLESQFQLNR